MSETAFERLVISQLQSLQESHKEIKEEIVAVGTIAEQALHVASQTLVQATATNGRVADLEGWQDSFEDEKEVGAAYAAGRKSVRDGDRAMLQKLWWLVAKYGPYAVGLLTFGLGVRLGAWLIGGPW